MAIESSASSEKQHIMTLIDSRSSRLQKLQEQQALEGISVDPKVPIEIEEIEAAIRELQAELDRMEAAGVSPKTSSGDVSEVSPSAVTSSERIEQYSDSSEFAMITQAFPLSGPTHIVYTCRSWFEEPPFICPSQEDTLGHALAVPSHVPVDELETCGLCFAWYGREILSGSEKSVKNCIMCSEQAIRLQGFDDCDTPTGDESLDEILQDNLIVIGENSFSNQLFQLVGHNLTWRHLSMEVIERPIYGKAESQVQQLQQLHRFRVRPIFKEHLGNRIGERDALCLEDEKFNCGIVTFVQNPFAIDKWILFLVGCRRPGQYLLLAWLRQSAGCETLKRIAAHRLENECRFYQIVVMGSPTETAKQRRILRDWKFETIEDISPSEPPSFFTSQPVDAFGAEWGEDICDLSLVAIVPVEGEFSKLVEPTIPNTLSELYEREKRNSDAGLHVTLYEFLHTRGVDSYGLAHSLIQGRGDFLNELRTSFANSPVFQLRARQTRLTKHSLQILVDVCADMGEHLRATGHWDRTILSPMDHVIECCRRARNTLSGEEQNRLNINRVPTPLHLTLLRFGPDTTDQQRREAESWALRYRNRSWGRIDTVSIMLARASRFPFYDVGGVQIR